MYNRIRVIIFYEIISMFACPEREECQTLTLSIWSKTKRNTPTQGNRISIDLFIYLSIQINFWFDEQSTAVNEQHRIDANGDDGHLHLINDAQFISFLSVSVFFHVFLSIPTVDMLIKTRLGHGFDCLIQ